MVEATSIYWHFVDVVWIVLFSVIYVIPNPLLSEDDDGPSDRPPAERAFLGLMFVASVVDLPLAQPRLGRGDDDLRARRSRWAWPPTPWPSARRAAERTARQATDRTRRPRWTRSGTRILDLTSRFVIPDWGCADRAHPDRDPGPGRPVHRLAPVAGQHARPEAARARPDPAGPAARRPCARFRRSPRSSARSACSWSCCGLVFGPVIVFVGIAALILALLYWGAEAMRDYDHVAHGARRCPSVVRPSRRPASTCRDRRSGRSSRRSQSRSCCSASSSAAGCSRRAWSCW